MTAFKYLTKLPNLKTGKFTYYYNTRPVGAGLRPVKMRMFGRESVGGARSTTVKVIGEGPSKMVTFQRKNAGGLKTRTYSNITPSSIRRFRVTSNGVAKIARGQGNWTSG